MSRSLPDLQAHNNVPLFNMATTAVQGSQVPGPSNPILLPFGNPAGSAASTADTQRNSWPPGIPLMPIGISPLGPNPAPGGATGTAPPRDRPWDTGGHIPLEPRAKPLSTSNPNQEVLFCRIGGDGRTEEGRRPEFGGPRASFAIACTHFRWDEQVVIIPEGIYTAPAPHGYRSSAGMVELSTIALALERGLYALNLADTHNPGKQHIMCLIHDGDHEQAQGWIRNRRPADEQYDYIQPLLDYCLLLLDKFEATGSRFHVNNAKARVNPVVRVCHYLCQAIQDPVRDAFQPVGLRMNSRGEMYWVDTDVTMRPVIPPPRSHHPYRGYEYSGSFMPLTDAFKDAFARSAEKYRDFCGPMPANENPGNFAKDKKPVKNNEWSEWPCKHCTDADREATLVLPARHSWIFAPDLCSDAQEHMRRKKIPNVTQQLLADCNDLGDYRILPFYCAMGMPGFPYRTSGPENLHVERILAQQARASLEDYARIAERRRCLVDLELVMLPYDTILAGIVARRNEMESLSAARRAEQAQLLRRQHIPGTPPIRPLSPESLVAGGNVTRILPGPPPPQTPQSSSTSPAAQPAPWLSYWQLPSSLVASGL